jgi:hypothetical protein
MYGDKYVHNFLLLNNIITSNQSGFAFGDSAINQWLNISNDFGRALGTDHLPYKGGRGVMVFCFVQNFFFGQRES